MSRLLQINLILFLFLTPSILSASGWEVLRDSTNSYSAEEILHAEQMVHYDRCTISDGIVHYSIWLRKKMPDTTGHQMLWIDNHNLKKITVTYYDSLDRLIHADISGLSIPQRQQKFNHPEYLFELPAQTRNLIIHIEPHMELRFRAELKSHAEMNTAIFLETIFSITPIGIMIGLFIIYFLLALKLGDVRIGVYLLFLLTSIIAIVGINGYLSYFLWPDNPAINRYISLFDGLPTIPGGILPIVFLQLRRNLKPAFYFSLSLVILQTVFLVIGLINPALYPYALYNLIVFLYLIGTLVISVYMWGWKNYDLAKYYTFGLIALTIGATLYILRAQGVISSELILINHATDFAIALEMVILGMGISRIIDKLRKEKTRVEEENIRIIAQQNRRLEELVTKRTRELDEKYELIRQQKEEITSINESLEEQVNQRTLRLSVQNDKLREYAYFNAHKVRGPLARILGMVQLFRNNYHDKEDIIIKIEKSAMELDEVVKDINKRLSESE